MAGRGWDERMGGRYGGAGTYYAWVGGQPTAYILKPNKRNGNNSDLINIHPPNCHCSLISTSQVHCSQLLPRESRQRLSSDGPCRLGPHPPSHRRCCGLLFQHEVHRVNLPLSRSPIYLPRDSTLSSVLSSVDPAGSIYLTAHTHDLVHTHHTYLMYTLFGLDE